MHFIETLGAISLTGSCENGFLWPIASGTETKFPRTDFNTYAVDFLMFRGEICLVRGFKDDDGVAGPISLFRVSTQETTHFPAAHSEVVRLAVSINDTSIVTAGEDGSIVLWQESQEVAPQSSSKEPRFTHPIKKGAASKPY